MKIAYISDIHSNLEALEAALQEISHMGVDRIYCLGDIVGYGADPNDCIELIRDIADGAIAGNHDFAAVGLTSTEHFNSFAQAAIGWTDEQLTESNRQYLKDLPFTCSNDNVFCVHATPIAPEKWGYIFSREDAHRHLEAFDEPICFIGHSHIPALFESKDRARCIVNIGSIGQPRDRDPRLSFVIFDTETVEFERIRLNYDIEKAAAQIRKAGLPEFLAERLFLGV